MPLADFVREVGSRDLTLTVVNRTDPDPVRDLLVDLFDGQSVAIEERESDPSADSNLVMLQEGDDEVAVSSLDTVRDSVLLVNSDLYVTGARDLEAVETPDVLAGLDEISFSVEGYPAAESKFVLIEMSRHIESRAWDVGEGVLHAGFQKISRIEDERGTRRVYERLANAGVETHVYGVPDCVPEDVAAHVHAEPARELGETWFVVFVPPEGGEHAALVCVETGRNEWDGFWTYDSDLVETIHAHLVETIHAHLVETYH